MDRRRFLSTLATGAIARAAAPRLGGQSVRSAAVPIALGDPSRFVLVNRTASPLVEGDRSGLRLSQLEGEGLAILRGTEFGEGTIEVELRRSAVAPRSALGIAFHGADATTFDAIYFSPFNFSAGDASVSGPAVHYHSPPRYTDARLRNERPSRYEQPVAAALDPNDWFRARIVVASSEVRAFVGDATEPCLDITLLNNREKGFLGLWLGNYSGGDFATLSVVPAQ